MRTLAVILLLFVYSANAQFGSYQSLNAPFGARNAALGGKVVSLADGDLMQFVHNPAVLDSVYVTDLSINFSPYFAGIYSFSGAYKAKFKKIGDLAVGMTYLNYGTFKELADNGDEIGEFDAQDYVLVFGKSHQISSFSLGANLKYAYSGIAKYRSSLLLCDLGGIYRAPQAGFTVGLVIKNLGLVIDKYYSGRDEVPFDVLVSTSIKPQNMPFRFSISAHSLVQNDLYFEDENEISTTKLVKTADQVFRRINVGTELIIHPNVQLLLGYSHLRRQELKLDNAAYGAGFSYGFLIGIKKIKFRYAHANYNAAGCTDFFTIQTNLNSFKKIL